MRMMSWAAVAFATASSAAAWSAAAAAENPAGMPSQVSHVLACQGEKDEQRRLACYDRAAAALASAARSGSVVVMDREDVRKARRSLFGFSLPRLPLFSGNDSPEEEEAREIEATIKSARIGRDDKWTLELDTGAMWQTTEADKRQQTPKAGQAVKIRKGALGSYMLAVEGRRWVRAMRAR